MVVGISKRGLKAVLQRYQELIQKKLMENLKKRIERDVALIYTAHRCRSGWNLKKRIERYFRESMHRNKREANLKKRIESKQDVSLLRTPPAEKLRISKRGLKASFFSPPSALSSILNLKKRIESSIINVPLSLAFKSESQKED